MYGHKKVEYVKKRIYSLFLFLIFSPFFVLIFSPFYIIVYLGLQIGQEPHVSPTSVLQHGHDCPHCP